MRFLEGPPLRPAKVAPPVRILVSAASPPGVPHLDLEPEIQGIKAVCTKIHPAPDLEIYRDATYRGLERVFHAAAVEGRQYHVWHHCGHGGFRNQGGDSEFVLALGKKRLELVSVDDLLPVLRIGSSLRVVVLNVCSAAAANGLALALARINVPFVVGFSSKIGDARARRFAIALFGGLLRVPLEAAVDLARAAIPERDTGACSWSEPLVLGRRSDRGGLVGGDGLVFAPAQQLAKLRRKSWRQKAIEEVRALHERESKR